MTTAHRRITRLQREILKTIRADVRKAMGQQSPALRRYYEAYQREFRGPARHSTKEELLKHCLRSRIILMGDYHTFAQSQKAALRLLRELVNSSSSLALACELVPSRHQSVLDDFMATRINESEFLERMEYKTNWGFKWENFRPLFFFAMEHNLQVIGLNHDSPHLKARDEHAALVLAEFAASNPNTRLLALYGDLHLARGHIPKYLRAALRSRQAKARTLTIFQNSETLYWRLAESRMAYNIDVLSLGRRRYCIMNAAPWVKLQSFLEWAESSELFDSAGGGAGDCEGPHLHEMAFERLRGLADALGFKLPEDVDLTIHTVDDLTFLTRLAGLSRQELKAVKYHVLSNRSTFIPGANIMYLASASVNQLCEGVSLLTHSLLSGGLAIFHDPREHFFAAVLASTIAYFGSKVLNHKRKCDLEDDFRLLLERKPLRHRLPAERLQRRVARLVLRHCRAQRDYLHEGRYRAPLKPRGPGRMPVFLETTHRLGEILGERLYASFIEGRYPTVKIERLFRTKLTGGTRTRKLYLKLVTDLARAPLSHTSKLDLF